MSLKQEYETTFMMNYPPEMQYLHGRAIPVYTHNILGADEYLHRALEDWRTGANLARIRREVTRSLGIDRHTPFTQIGEFINTIRKDKNSTTYQSTKLALYSEILPHYGLDAQKKEDRDKFDNLFDQASRYPDKAVEYGVQLLKHGLDAVTFSYTEMLEDTKITRDFIHLLALTFDPDIRKSYEARRKLITALHDIPIIQKQNDGVDSEVFTILDRHNVTQDALLVNRTLIAKVYLEDGRCTEWMEYDPNYHLKLRHGSENGRLWKEMVFSFPSRLTLNNTKVHLTSRINKKRASTCIKTERKLTTDHPDDYAMRVVIDEKSGNVTEQIRNFLSNMFTAFCKEGYSINLAPGQTDTNSLTDSMYLTGEGFDITIPGNIFNQSNECSSNLRKVCQLVIVISKGDECYEFEVQFMDTLGNINRITNRHWNDTHYKVTQFFRSLPHNPSSCPATLLFPEYYLGCDVTMYQEEIERCMQEAVLNDKPRSKLPRSAVLYQEQHSDT